MLHIYLSDIRGESDSAIRHLKKIYGQGSEQRYFTITPYVTPPDGDGSEDYFYQYFTHHVGIQGYLNKVLRELSVINEDFVLVGCSVGATVAWLASALDLPRLVASKCFYGSRIRDYLNEQPRVAVEVIFSRDELYFLDSFTAKYANEPLVKIHKIDLDHGFLNEESLVGLILPHEGKQG